MLENRPKLSDVILFSKHKRRYIQTVPNGMSRYGGSYSVEPEIGGPEQSDRLPVGG